jgi:hypothetical protein
LSPIDPKAFRGKGAKAIENELRMGGVDAQKARRFPEAVNRHIV